MNDQDFILLIEQYLDGSISAAGRRALSDTVQADPERRRLFEGQARQHVRLHAQTSRVDFTESQRVAVMVMDVAEKEHPSHFIDTLKNQTVRERLNAIARGLRAPRGSGPNRYARFALLRLFGPATLSLVLNLAVILLLIFLTKPEVLFPDHTDYGPIVDLAPPMPGLQTPDGPPESPAVKPPDATVAGPGGGADSGLKTTIPRSPWDDSMPGAPTESGTLTPVAGLALPEPLTPVALLAPFAGSAPGFRNLPESLAGRTPEGRRKAIAASDGNLHTERAVITALDWLRSHQQDDGSWAGQEPAAMTGLALLAFLAHGELPASPEFGPAVRKGLDYLLNHQDAAGVFSKNVYAHAIATYAVAEAATLTHHMGLHDAMERAVVPIVAGQQRDGSYDYNYAQDVRFDTSVTGWQIQALKAAKLAGCSNPSLGPALDRCVRFLKTEAFAGDGSGFVYTGSPGAQPASGATWTMTGVGTLSLQLLDQAHAPQTRAGLKALDDITFAWPSVAGGKPRVYGDYYVTQAKFQQNNKSVWHAWNQRLQQVLLAQQKSDGHWEGGDYDQGSHVYTTTLCTLMLEVYYRYLPTYGVATNVLTTASSGSDDVGVRVH